MKKRIALLLAALMLFLLAACGEPAAPAEETAAETAVEPVEEPAAESDLAYVKKKGTLVVGITHFKPMDFKSDAGTWIGFDADMAKAFSASIGVDAEFVEIEWENKTALLDNKVIDCVWNGMTLTEEIKAVMECSNAYCNNAQAVIVPTQDAKKYQTAEACKDLVFAVESGSTGEAELQKLGYAMIPVKSQADTLKKLAAKECGAAVIDSLMAAEMVGPDSDYKNLTYTVQLNSEEYGVGFRKGSDLTKELNIFFATAYADGLMQKVAENYGVQAAIIPQNAETVQP